MSEGCSRKTGETPILTIWFFFLKIFVLIKFNTPGQNDRHKYKKQTTQVEDSPRMGFYHSCCRFKLLLDSICPAVENRDRNITAWTRNDDTHKTVQDEPPTKNLRSPMQSATARIAIGNIHNNVFSSLAVERSEVGRRRESMVHRWPRSSARRLVVSPVPPPPTRQPPRRATDDNRHLAAKWRTSGPAV